MAGVRKRLGSLLGPQGHKGDKGDRGDQGLHGLDAVPTSEGVAQYLTVAGAPRNALDARVDERATPIRGVRSSFDIWGGFAANGSGSGSWNAMTYAGWIDGIDARLAGRGVAKTLIGTTTDGKSIWAYTAGPADAPHALIVSGTHGIESMPQWAAMRFFTEFVDNPAMRPLRSRLRLTWVPTLSPSAYLSSRYTSDNVDPARNFDFYWEYWTSTTETHPKGPSAMSSPEAKAVKKLLDDFKIACVIDCHTSDSGGVKMAWDGPSVWTAGNRVLAFNAASRWDQTYNAAGTAQQGEYGMHLQGYPQLINYANRYLLFDKKRHNTASLLIESHVDLAGSVSLQTLTAEAARLWGGFLHTYLTEWLENGQAQPQLTPRMTSAARLTSAATTSVADGGSRVESNTFAPLQWDSTPYMLGGTTRKFIDVLIPAPGQLELECLLVLRAITGNTAASEVAAHFRLGPTPAAGGDVAAQAHTQAHAHVPAPSGLIGGRTILPVKARFNYTGPGLVRVQLNAALAVAGMPPVEIVRGNLMATWFPNDGSQVAPLVPLLS